MRAHAPGGSQEVGQCRGEVQPEIIPAAATIAQADAQGAFADRGIGGDVAQIVDADDGGGLEADAGSGAPPRDGQFAGGVRHLDPG